MGRILAQLPKRVDGVLRQVEHDRLGVRVALQPETRKDIQGVRRSVRGLTWTVASVGVLLAGVLLYVGDRLATALSTGQECATTAPDCVSSCQDIGYPTVLEALLRKAYRRERFQKVQRTVIYLDWPKLIACCPAKECCW